MRIKLSLSAGLLIAIPALAQDTGIASFAPWPKSPPEVIARGQSTYNTNCASCHGADARGKVDGGPNIIRSDVFMKDQRGEAVIQFLETAGANVHNARLTPDQVSDIAAFVHAFGINSRDPGRMRPPTLVVGDAEAGAAYFRQKCASCHAATGDLKGIATRIAEPRSLQQTWLMPVVAGARGPINPSGRYKPVTVTVTPAGGTPIDGTLVRLDDFIVIMKLADGGSRTFRRDGEFPKVEVHDPMKGHKDLLPVYTDRDIHNVTAYLVTLK